MELNHERNSSGMDSSGMFLKSGGRLPLGNHTLDEDRRSLQSPSVAPMPSQARDGPSPLRGRRSAALGGGLRARGAAGADDVIVNRLPMNLAYLLATFGWPPAMLGADYRFYEASALAIAEFRHCGFTANAPGPATRLTVSVKAPATSHEVRVSKIEAWLQSGGRSPAE
jgi:hypothetical protein